MSYRYFIDHKYRETEEGYTWEPIGIWIQGPGPGLDIEMIYKPGNEEAQEEADWVINRLVEAGIKTLPEDFLDYHQGKGSLYFGMRSPIETVEEWPGPLG